MLCYLDLNDGAGQRKGWKVSNSNGGRKVTAMATDKEDNKEDERDPRR